MPNRNRAAGDYLERTTKAALEARGWYVTRAAGSLGPADLVALRSGVAPLLVACKTNGTIGPAERVQLVRAAELAGARPILASRARRGWLAFLRVDEYGTTPYAEPMRVPKRAAAPAPDEGTDDEGK